MELLRIVTLSAIVLLAGIGATFLLGKFVWLLVHLENEAKEKNKLIEYSMFWIAVLSVVISLGLAFYNIYITDKIDDRVKALEQRSGS